MKTTTKIPFYQILIFIVAVSLLVYIFYDFIRRRQITASIKEGMVANEPFYKEVMTEIGYREIDDKELPSGVADVSKQGQDMELMQYCVKGSINSAYSGEYISDEMVKYVLSRGCRFIDFEVYHLPIGDSPEEADVFAAYVGYSSDPSSVNSTTKNNYLFRKIFKSALANAFTRQSGDKYESPNPKDPLFVHIRIKTDEKTKDKLYDMIQKDINSVFNSGYNDYFLMRTNRTNNQLESVKVSGKTPLKRLSQKVVILFDYEPETYIGTYHNTTSDSAELMKITYDEMNTFRYRATPPKKLNSNKVNIDKWKMAVPDSNRSSQSNPNIAMAIKNYGVQATLMQYYNTDMQLIRAESLFQQYGAAIVPMSVLLNHIQTHAEDDTSTTISPKLFDV